MCLHGYAHYACGHIRRADRQCELARAADDPFYKEIACPNYKISRKHVGTKCGSKDYYCSQTPDGQRITDAEIFLRDSEVEAQRLDGLMSRDADMYRRFDAFARRNNMSPQDMLNYPGYQRKRARTQKIINDRHALQIKQRQAVQLITYVKDHIDDEPHEVGRNHDGTSIYSIFPVGFGEQTMAPNHQPGPAPLPYNPVQQQFNPALLPGYTQQPAMGSNQMAPQMYGHSHQFQTPVAPNPTGHAELPLQPPRFQQPHPHVGLPQPMQFFNRGPQGYNPPSGPPLTPSQRFEKEKQVRDLQAQYGSQLAKHQRNIARGVQPERSQQMGTMRPPREPHESDQDTVSARSPAVTSKKGNDRSPDTNDEPVPLRRSTRARAKAVKYKESPESTGDPSSKEQSPVKSVVNSDANSDGYRESSEKSESSSYSDIRGRKRRHLSEEAEEELEELIPTETKKPGRGRISLTNRIADYQKRSGTADAPVGPPKRRLKPFEYAHGGGGRMQSSMIDPVVYGQQQQHALQNAQYMTPAINPNNAPSWIGNNGDPFQRRGLPRNAVPYGGPGQGYIGTQQRHYSPSNYAHPQPVRGQPSRLLPNWPADNEVIGAHQAPRRAPAAYDIHPNMLSGASNAYMAMENQRTNASNDLDAHTGRAHAQPMASRYNTNSNGHFADCNLDPALRQVQDTPQFLNPFPADGLGYPTGGTGDSVSGMRQYSGPNTALGQDQAQQAITIPSFRGSITLPASSNLFNRHAAQSFARSAANPLAQIPNLPINNSANSVPPAYHFTANQTPTDHPSSAQYDQLRRSFENTTTLTPRSSNHANPAETTTDPTKKPTPTSDNPSPRKRVRLSMPGEEGAPVWPAAWRKEQQQQVNTDDPFLTTAAQPADLNIEHPPDMGMLNSGFDPTAPQQEQLPTSGTDDLSNVFLEAVEAAEANTQAEQAANVLMNLGNSDAGEGDVDWNDLNFE